VLNPSYRISGCRRILCGKAMIQFELGILFDLLREQRFGEADHLQHALEVQPNLSSAHNNPANIRKEQSAGRHPARPGGQFSLGFAQHGEHSFLPWPAASGGRLAGSLC
jgi:hypothetical protein